MHKMSIPIFKPGIGVRFSEHHFSYAESILSIPLYAVEAMPSLISEALEMPVS